MRKKTQTGKMDEKRHSKAVKIAKVSGFIRFSATESQLEKEEK